MEYDALGPAQDPSIAEKDGGTNPIIPHQASATTPPPPAAVVVC